MSVTEPAARDDERAKRARQWLLSSTNATLCTLSTSEALRGWPFGSLVPFALRENGAPFVLISEIAEHTRNLRADPRVSLFVRDPEADADAQASWRLTVMGRAQRLTLDGGALEALHARYAARVPDAPGYFDTHGFGYWQIEPLRVRVIGGFGAITWLEGDAILRDPLGGGIAEASSGILEHMNEDHETALIELCAAAAPNRERPEGARMVSLDRAGCLVATRAPDALRHIGFGREIGAADARAVFVELTRAARAALSLDR
jgi:hypothetical protein